MNLKVLKNMFKYNKDTENIDFEFYQSIDILCNLTKSEIMKLNDLFIYKKYKRGETIFRENHPNPVFYIIKSGKVRLFINLPYEEVTVNDLGAKKHFGEIGIFLETNRITSAVTLEDSELIAVKKSDIKQFIKSNPGTGIKLLYNLGKTISNDLVQVLNNIKQHDNRH